MYTLRIVEGTRESNADPFEQVIENFELGDSYSYIERGTKEFKSILKRMYPTYVENKNIRAIICGENQKEFFIMKDLENKINSYFIMSDSGKTFERL